jgi:hypothetical protein
MRRGRKAVQEEEWRHIRRAGFAVKQADSVDVSESMRDTK